MRNIGLSDQIRKRAVAKYIEPARRNGVSGVAIRVKDLMNELEPEGFPPNHPAQFCSALQARSFLLREGLEIERVEGPASGKSTTVVLHYRLKLSPSVASSSLVGATNPQQSSDRRSQEEDPALLAFRLTKKLRGLLREELAAYGGAEGFMRWVRSDEDDTAA